MNIEGVFLTKLKIISNDKGDIYHSLKKNEKEFKEFGEAYFSTIKYNCVKAWKKHFKMTLNLVVPAGEVKFVLYDDRDESPTKNNVLEISLSPENYYRLTIPPDIWLGFKGISESLNLVQNISDIVHDSDEQINIPMEEFHFKYQWD